MPCTTQTEVKLSEIAIGIGPFVIAPAVLRKIGTAALSELSLAAHAGNRQIGHMPKGCFLNCIPTSMLLKKL